MRQMQHAVCTMAAPSIRTLLKYVLCALRRLITSKAQKRPRTAAAPPRPPIPSIKSDAWSTSSIGASPNSTGRYRAHLLEQPNGDFLLYVKDRISSLTWCLRFKDLCTLNDYLISLQCRDFQTTAINTPISTSRSY